MWCRALLFFTCTLSLFVVSSSDKERWSIDADAAEITLKSLQISTPMAAEGGVLRRAGSVDPFSRLMRRALGNLALALGRTASR